MEANSRMLRLDRPSPPFKHIPSFLIPYSPDFFFVDQFHRGLESLDSQATSGASGIVEDRCCCLCETPNAKRPQSRQRSPNPRSFFPRLVTPRLGSISVAATPGLTWGVCQSQTTTKGDLSTAKAHRSAVRNRQIFNARRGSASTLCKSVPCSLRASAAQLQRPPTGQSLHVGLAEERHSSFADCP